MVELTLSEPSDQPRHRARCCRSCCKSFLTFLFSTVGLTLLLVVYSVVGGVVFMKLEWEAEMSDNPNRTAYAIEMKRLRLEHLDRIFEVTMLMNLFHKNNWTRETDEILKDYTTATYKYTKMIGWDGGDLDEESQWSFAGSLLYAITVITTIGYGGVSPKTPLGQIVTIVYAIFGIPLTLLTITNLGGFMATAFRFLYRNVCCTICCCVYPAQAPTADQDPEAGTGNRNPPPPPTRWTRVRQGLTNTDDVRNVQVPIIVSLMLIGGYLALGALVFTLWESDWTYLVGFYFCFVTLSTIGFGDYVPTGSTRGASQGKRVLCALYLLIGLSLVAMCIKLMYERARSLFRKLGRRLGLVHE